MYEHDEEHGRRARNRPCLVLTSPRPSALGRTLTRDVRVHDANTAFEAIVEVAFPAAASEHLRLDDNVLACPRIVPPSAQRCSVSMRASVGRGGGRRART